MKHYEHALPIDDEEQPMKTLVDFVSEVIFEPVGVAAQPINTIAHSCTAPVPAERRADAAAILLPLAGERQQAQGALRCALFLHRWHTQVKERMKV